MIRYIAQKWRQYDLTVANPAHTGSLTPQQAFRACNVVLISLPFNLLLPCYLLFVCDLSSMAQGTHGRTVLIFLSYMAASTPAVDTE